MIYTITFNPAIDYVVSIDNMGVNKINRTNQENIFFGGKGINVSCVLKELGYESVALGFVAGFTGEALENGLQKQGIKTDFVHIQEGFTRINVKIKSDDETEINGQGPEISEKNLEALFEKLDTLQDGDVLVLAGSIPNTLPDNIYERILEALGARKIKVVVDATKALLLNALPYEPFLIKPNSMELGDIFRRKLGTHEEIIECAQRLQAQGAKNVLVSMAKAGSILLDERGKAHYLSAPQGEAINSVGAGDSMVAGFLAGLLNTNDYSYAHQLGTAAGSATAFSKGLAKKEAILELMDQIK